MVILHKLILQTCMCSHSVGLDVWFLVGPFVYFHTSCVRTVKALARLRQCAGSPEPSLVAYVISTIISWACSFSIFSYKVYVVGIHLNCPTEAILMNTHNIYFNWDLKNIIPKLSSKTHIHFYNIIEYPHYLFFGGLLVFKRFDIEIQKYGSLAVCNRWRRFNNPSSFIFKQEPDLLCEDVSTVKY